VRAHWAAFGQIAYVNGADKVRLIVGNWLVYRPSARNSPKRETVVSEKKLGCCTDMGLRESER